MHSHVSTTESDFDIVKEERIEEQKINAKCHNSMEEASHTLLQIQKLTVANVKGQHQSAVTLWDGGSTLCFITFGLANKLHLQGDPIALEVITIGGNFKRIDSQKYMLWLVDKKGRRMAVEVI